MPDVWTFHPKMLKDALTGAGLTCGVEPRVLKPRDPNWTCHVNAAGWRGDIYIHHAASPYSSSPFFDYHVAALLVVFAAGYLSGKVMQRRDDRTAALGSKGWSSNIS